MAWDKPGGRSASCPGGGRHRDGVSPEQALVRNAGTCAVMPRETLQVADPRGAEYRCGGGDSPPLLDPSVVRTRWSE